MKAHTPIPWILNRDSNDIRDTAERMIVKGDYIHGHDIKDERFSSGKVLKAEDDGGGANASFIVRACNNHDALVAALNKAERLLTFLDGSGNNDPTPDRAYVSEVRRECLAALQAAGE